VNEVGGIERGSDFTAYGKTGISAKQPQQALKAGIISCGHVNYSASRHSRNATPFN
jgi:hypothetical protein